MTKTNEKIHVLADESLGGIIREYVEVNRKAEVGEKIVIVDKKYPDDIYKNGDIFTVDREVPPGSGYVGSDGAASDMNTGGLIYRGEYRILEPTNIVHIDGPDGTERYEMVDREAEVGEKFIIVNADVQTEEPYSNGDVFTVDESWGAGDVVTVCGRLINRREYRILVPVESSEEEPQPSDLIDVVSNLATRVAELERENRRIKDEIDTLHKDNLRHGEELESLKYAAKETGGKVAHLEADIEESFPATDAPLVFICRKPGRFEVYQDGKKLHGVMSVRINAKVGEFATHEIEYISGATEEERQ